MGPVDRIERIRVPLFLDLGQRWAAMDPSTLKSLTSATRILTCQWCWSAPYPLQPAGVRAVRARPNPRMELSGYWHYRQWRRSAAVLGTTDCSSAPTGRSWIELAVAAVTYAGLGATKAAGRR
jgi:hypothetical protein